MTACRKRDPDDQPGAPASNLIDSATAAGVHHTFGLVNSARFQQRSFIVDSVLNRNICAMVRIRTRVQPDLVVFSASHNHGIFHTRAAVFDVDPQTGRPFEVISLAICFTAAGVTVTGGSAELQT
jgi:hypothetical protein